MYDVSSSISLRWYSFLAPLLFEAVYLELEITPIVGRHFLLSSLINHLLEVVETSDQLGMVAVQ